jgi:hypothetical protein
MRFTYDTLEQAKQDGWSIHWLAPIQDDFSQPYRIYAGRRHLDGRFMVYVIRNRPFDSREIPIVSHQINLTMEPDITGRLGRSMDAVRSEDMIAAINEAIHWAAPQAA